MARRRFFVDRIADGQAWIEGERAHHLANVLRATPGERFEISDNRRVYLAEVESVRKDRIAFTVVEPMDAPGETVRVTLLASLTKFERLEWMLEKVTELGVQRIVPVIAERTEKGLEQAAGKRLARWQRIVREASEQSRRVRLPEVEATIPLAEALRRAEGYRFALDEGEARPILSALPQNRTASDRVELLVGPEGGWTDRERAAMPAANWTAVSLGPNILRAETAAAAGVAIIQAAWAGV